VRLRTAFRRLLLVLAFASRAYPGAPETAKPIPPQPKLGTVAVVVDKAEVKAGDKVVATVEKGRMFGVIERQGDLVEIQVCVGTDIRRGTLPTSAVKFLTDDDIDLAAEWLKVAKDLNPNLDVPACRAKLDALIDRVAAAAAAGKTPRQKARLIGVQLFEREGFTNKLGVKTPDHLLDLKQGDCFGFSFLYLCIGQKPRMPLCLVTSPDHAFVRYEDRGERFNIETTQQGKLHDTDGYLREPLGVQRFSQVGGTHLVSLPVPSALGALFYAWGKLRDDVGNSAEACEMYAKAAEINPRDSDAYYNWGLALGKMGKPVDACAMCAKAVETNPRHAGAYSNWGVALGAIGKPSEACEKYAKAVEIDSRLVEAYNNWGVALGKMGKPAEACEKYAMALKINPQYARACFNWGVALRAMGKAPEACEKFAKAVEINPRLAEAHCGWAAMLHVFGRYAQACEKFATAIEINPQYANAYFNWGLALKALLKNAEAIEKLDKAAELDPALRPKVEELRKELLGK